MSDARLTPLHPLHDRLGAKFISFAGWDMPVSYSGAGIMAEHLHTRKECSLFDVSHMCLMRLPAEGAAEALERLLPLTAAAVKPGRNKYTFACSKDGGIIDDMMMGNDGDSYFIVCNAARAVAVIGHFNANLPDSLPLRVIDDRALIAVQGPKAEDVIAEKVFPGCRDMRFMDSVTVEGDHGKARFSRSGYTGEDGFEISVPAEFAEGLASDLLKSGVCKPAGLGARDSLRLEAGLCLYGQDISLDVSPAEANLGWAIPASARKRASFLGADHVLHDVEHGAKRSLVGLSVSGKSPARSGCEIFAGDVRVGEVTSGCYSPTLEKPIALALVDSAQAETGNSLVAKLRGKDIPCQVTTLPFVQHNYKLSKPAGKGGAS